MLGGQWMNIGDLLKALPRVEELYAADRESEALQLLDRCLGMPAGFEAQLQQLRDLERDLGAASIDSALVPHLLALRSKCLASGRIRIDAELTSLARDHVRLLDELCPGRTEFGIYGAQLSALLDDVEDGLRRIDGVLRRAPGDERAARTKKALEQMAAAEAATAVPLLLEGLGELTRQATAAGGDMTPSLALPWLRLLSELAQQLSRRPADTFAWSYLLMHLMNGHLYAEAAVAMRALQAVAPSPSSAVDAVLGPGATQRMLSDLEQHTNPDDTSQAARPAPAESATSISETIRRTVADMSSTLIVHWLPRLLEVIDGTSELSDAEKASFRFMLGACETKPIVSERHFLELAVLACAIGSREAGSAALRRAIECRGRRGPSRDEDVLGFMAQSLLNRT